MQQGTVAEVAGSQNDGRCGYTMILTAPVAGLRDVLAAIGGITNLQVEGERVTLEYSSQRADAAALLAELVARGIPVASFAPHAPGLEEAYLRTGIRQVE